MPTLAHKIQLDPTPTQRQLLAQHCGACRVAYNWGLARWKELYEAGEKPNINTLRKEFNRIKRETFPWIVTLRQMAPDYALINLGKAFDRFFKKQGGYPKFKKRGMRDSFYIHNTDVKHDGRSVRIPKLGWVKTREELRFEGKINNAVVSREADRWFIAISVQVPEAPYTVTGADTVGIDLGLTWAVTLSTGEQYAAPNPLKTQLRHLRRLSKNLSRKQKRSENRYDARMRLARLHRKIRNLRQDWIHRITTDIAKRYKTIVIEDLNVRGMMANSKLSRYISDIGWRELRRQLEYKAEMAGGQVIIADRWFASSKLCSGCGEKKTDLLLSDRTYMCSHCGLVIDRDHNAALNLANVALRQKLPDVMPVEMAGSDSTQVESVAV